ncbi:MAG: hypothetical protein JRG84_10930 [Deltaproteobacteria bacterium]|nr:hypothetical protein [Deltaproteobacteria bacterium]
MWVESGAIARRRISAAILAGVLLGLGLGTPALAIDPALCSDDGVTEIPPFATGRDIDDCLLVDPGNGEALVQFQYEVFHQTGIIKGCDRVPKTAPVVDHKMDDYGRCTSRTLGIPCTLIFWDVTFDNYLDPACENSDILTYGEGTPLVNLWFKDTQILNAWKCDGGGGWQGPNGIECAPGQLSGAHTDGIQMRGQPSVGGWFILQDSVLANAHINLLLHQSQSDYPPNGSVLWQGVQFGQFNTPLGAATNWVDDCLARGSSTDTCAINRARVGYQADEIWLIDVWGPTRFAQMVTTYGKVVIVNTGCGTTGCGGTTEFFNGWPHPLDGEGAGGPGVCPDGLIPSGCAGGANSGPCYCYTSIENALTDVFTPTSNTGDCPDCPHARPPFLQFSDAGWETPPGGP